MIINATKPRYQIANKTVEMQEYADLLSRRTTNAIDVRPPCKIDIAGKLAKHATYKLTNRSIHRRFSQLTSCKLKS